MLFLLALASQVVPERREPLAIEVSLMVEECKWENGRQTILDGLRCVKGKIETRIKQLEEDAK
jgi:hypothetical protein